MYRNVYKNNIRISNIVYILSSDLHQNYLNSLTLCYIKIVQIFIDKDIEIHSSDIESNKLLSMLHKSAVASVYLEAYINTR